MARGAGFDASADDPLRSEPVVILSHQFWQERLSADPDIVGKTLTMDRVPHLVVGVGPDQFGGHIGFTGWDLFVPLERHPRLLAGTAADAEANFRGDRSKEWVLIHGRLSPGLSVEQASAAVAAVTARLATMHPATNELKHGIAAAYDPLGFLVRPQLRIFQTVGLTLTGLVLLVVSLNISGMMQVRGALRERELSIRQAIGASRGRLAQYLLSESIVLACAGGALASIVIFNIPSLLPWLTDDPIPPSSDDAFPPSDDTFAEAVKKGVEELEKIRQQQSEKQERDDACDPKLVAQARHLYTVGERCHRQGDMAMAENCFRETFPKLKKEYIDTGKVRFIIREFPIGKTSGAATIALRCAKPDKYLELYGKFLEQQPAWVSQEVRLDPIFKVASHVGMTRQQFDACRENQAMIDGLKWVKDRGRTLGIIGTPNFFIGSTLVKKVLTIEEIRAMVEQQHNVPAAASVGSN